MMKDNFTDTESSNIEEIQLHQRRKKAKSALSLVLKLGSEKVITVFNPVKVRAVGDARKICVTGINPKNNQLTTFTGTLVTNFDQIQQPLSI